MRTVEVFTPNDQPTVTYVRRDNVKLEERLRSALSTPKMVTSLSGPSKTGKTVLIKSVLHEDNLIYLRGAYIKSINDFWNAILAWFEAPSAVTKISGTSFKVCVGAKAGGEAGIPLVAKGKAEGQIASEIAKDLSTANQVALNPFEQVTREIGGSDFTIFLDDYHYMPPETQVDLAKIIKSLAESGVRICTALVPHRSEDVLKANPELRGRIVAIDIPEWSNDELKIIAQRGFKELNVDIAPTVISRLATEAMGSPQLMQVLCLNLCNEIGVHKAVQGDYERTEIHEIQLSEIFENSANFASSSDLVQALHSGPKVKGQPRTQYVFIDGSRGDVYRAILLAITSDPVARDFTYDDLYARVKSVCVGESPTGQSISQSLNHMCAIAAKMSGDQIAMEWDDANLHIADPYLAFYMRASSKIEQLKPKG